LEYRFSIDLPYLVNGVFLVFQYYEYKHGFIQICAKCDNSKNVYTTKLKLI